MKKILSIVALSTLLIACSQNNQQAQQSATDQAERSSSNTATQKEQSKYAPYSKEEVEAKVQALTQIVENDTEYLPAAVKQAEPYRVCRRLNILRDYSDEKTKLYPRN